MGKSASSSPLRNIKTDVTLPSAELSDKLYFLLHDVNKLIEN
jgi:hypothetical protein